MIDELPSYAQRNAKHEARALRDIELMQAFMNQDLIVDANGELYLVELGYNPNVHDVTEQYPRLTPQDRLEDRDIEDLSEERNAKLDALMQSQNQHILHCIPRETSDGNVNELVLTNATKIAFVDKSKMPLFKAARINDEIFVKGGIWRLFDEVFHPAGYSIDDFTFAVNGDCWVYVTVEWTHPEVGGTDPDVHVKVNGVKASKDMPDDFINPRQNYVYQPYPEASPDYWIIGLDSLKGKTDVFHIPVARFLNGHIYQLQTGDDVTFKAWRGRLV